MSLRLNRDGPASETAQQGGSAIGRVARRSVVETAFLPVVTLGVVSVCTVIMIGLDVWSLARENQGSDYSSPVTMQRPSSGDQIRPYLPSTRPVAPGRDIPNALRRSGTSETAPMDFVRVGDIVRAHGTIAPGTSSALERFLTDLPEGEAETLTLELHSPGGIVQEAIAMAQALRDSGIKTSVPEDHYCASSCPLVFAGGAERLAHAASWIGVHRAYPAPGIFGSLQDGVDQAQRIAAEIQDLLKALDVDPLVWTYAMRTPKEQVYFFTAEELETLKLATTVEAADQS
jgi:hypothetical protein